jgi:hypothetical protein
MFPNHTISLRPVTVHPTLANGLISSDPIEELEDPTLFPHIGTWLEELNNGVRGSDGHHFAQYGAALDNNKFTRIFQLEDLTELIALCPGMPAGTATLIIGMQRRM